MKPWTLLLGRGTQQPFNAHPSDATTGPDRSGNSPLSLNPGTFEALRDRLAHETTNGRPRAHRVGPKNNGVKVRCGCCRLTSQLSQPGNGLPTPDHHQQQTRQAFHARLPRLRIQRFQWRGWHGDG